VLLSSGQVSTVDFKTYVKDVLPNEWIAGWNPQALRAGAIAAKSYAWYWANHSGDRSANGQCFDVYDNTNSQVYKAGSHQPSTDAAVDDTWGIVLRRGGAVMEAQYRATLTGNTGEACGAGADGTKASQWGSQTCAQAGENYAQILNTYYSGITLSQSTSTPVGDVFDNIRYATDGSWQQPRVADNGGAVNSSVVVGMPNGDMHLLTLSAGIVYDNIRFAGDGHWQGAREADNGGHVQAIAATAMPNGDLHLETLTGGLVYDNIRYATDGHWQGARVADNGGHVQAIAVAGMPNGDLHLETLTGGIVYDNIRYATDGTWQQPRVADSGGHVDALAVAAMPNGDLHLETLTGGLVYDNIRFAADGSWQQPRIADNGGHVQAISITGMPNGDMHLETLV
jgi:hypothetical protein